MNMHSLSDEQLVTLAKEDNAGATVVLFERHKSTINSVTRSYFLSGYDAEDLTQEGMITMLKAINSFNVGGNTSFKSYLCTCVKNRIKSLIRDSKREKRKSLNEYVPITGYLDIDADKSEIMINADFGPEEQYINRENASHMERVIKDALSDLEYKILTYYLQGYSYLDIAEKLSREQKSIDNAIQRIRKKLQNTLKGGE